MGRIQSLQVLRFFAALGVVWEHAATWKNPHALTGGAAGVDLFFVLSGYVISAAAQSKSATFLRDRLSRIFPIYWLLAVAWIAFAVGREPFDGWRLFTTVTLLPASTSAPLDNYVGVGWTLSFEILFYAVVWLVLRGLSWRAALAAYGALALAAVFIPSGLLRFFGSPMVVEFLLGAAAFRLGRGRSIAGAVALALVCAAFPFVPRMLTLPQAALVPWLGLGRVALLGPLAFLAVWGAAQLDCSALLWRPFVLLGDASYSLYLSHFLVLLVVLDIAGRTVPPALACALCVVVSVPLYLWIERPLLRWSRAFVRVRSLSPAAAE